MGRTLAGVRARITAPGCVLLTLLVWSALWGVAHVRGAGLGWHYFILGDQVLVGRDPLQLYAQHSELQIGPLALVASAPFAAIGGPAGEVAAMAAMQAAGVGVLYAVRRFARSRSAPRADVSTTTFLLAGLLFVPVWSEVAVHWAHLDDALALGLGILAIWAAAADRYLLAAALAAAAADAKPWAIGFVAVILVSRRWWKPGLVAAAVLAVAWLPFTVADTRSLAAASYAISVDRASVLHLLGVSDTHTPGWCRPVQLVLIAMVAVVVVARGRTGALILVVVAARLLVDPATKNYYDAGLALGAACYDLAIAQTLAPWATVAAVVGVWAPSYLMVSLPTERGVVRVVMLAALLVVGLFGDLRQRLLPRAQPTASSDTRSSNPSPAPVRAGVTHRRPPRAAENPSDVTCGQ